MSRQRETPPPTFSKSGWEVCRTQYDAGENAFYEALFALSNGRLGLRPTVDFDAEGRPGFFHADVYGPSVTAGSHLVNILNPTFRALTVGGVPVGLNAAVEFQEILDLSQATVRLDAKLRDHRGRLTRLHVESFLPAQYSDVVATRMEITRENHDADIVVTVGIDFSTGNGDYGGTHSGVRLHHLVPTIQDYAAGRLFVAAENPPEGGLVVADAAIFADAPLDRGPSINKRRLAEAIVLPAGRGRPHVITALAVVDAGQGTDIVRGAHLRLNDVLAEGGWTALLSGHTEAWRARWATATRLYGRADVVHAWRYAQFHLLQAPDRGRSVTNQAARGLTSEYHSGHVFFNSEFFLLPYFAHLEPDVARAMLRFRVASLPAALDHARDTGYAGARYPEEADHLGRPASPHVINDIFSGVSYTENSGDQVKHTSADVLHGLATYVNVTRDEAFLCDEALPLVVEAARYLADLMQPDPSVGGRGARNVMGFDEYHYQVDHSFGTNALAKWALCWAAETVERYPATTIALSEEPARWRQIAAEIHLPTARDGVFPAFEGYFDLPDQLRRSSNGHRLPSLEESDSYRAELLEPFSTQLLKQSDVVFAMTLIPEWFDDLQLGANLAYCEPRTVHGSSVSMMSHGVAAARLGWTELATELMLASLRYNLDFSDRRDYDNGIHLAAYAGAWHILLQGFLGARIHGNTLHLKPRLPDGVDRLDIPVAVYGWRLTVSINLKRTRLRADEANPGDVHVVIDECAHVVCPGKDLEVPLANVPTVIPPLRQI